MKFVKASIFLHLFFLLMRVEGQNVPWVVHPTSVTHTVNIASASITVDNVPISNGDAVGLFYDSIGNLACGGLAIWPATVITAYGDDSGEPNGFEVDEAFKFKIWKKQENCIIDSGTIVQFQTQPPVFNDSIYFKENGTSKMITLNGARKNIFYPKDIYCQSDPNPAPVVIGTIPDVVYSSQPGLALNPSTGTIDIAASTPGTYVVYFQTSLCLKNTSFKLHIKFNLAELQFSTVLPECATLGSLKIDESTIICGTAPYQYRLRSIATGEDIIASSSLIEDIPEGFYELYVKDASGIEQKFNSVISLKRNCKDPILAPYSVNNASYFIAAQGTAKIYDRYGMQVKQLEIPADWNATDDKGNLVPAGQYLIICNEKERIVLSVIK